jgi:phage shock protein E
MFALLKKLLGIGPEENYKALVAQGAKILDVRSKGEFQRGSIKGAVNFPLDHMPQQLPKLKKDAIIITCCASGRRSGIAKNILQQQGYTQVYNGGGWQMLQHKLS